MTEAKRILKKYWGYSEFKPLQQEIITSVLEGNNTFAILPTGGGKSLCYQIPALMIEGMTLVISPLIALMQDQVNHLKEKGINAELITYQMQKELISDILNRCLDGEVKLLYISPERLQNKNFTEILRDMDIRLIAVDEAHCIAQWGHDFRPAYLKINVINEYFPEINILALTATAPPKTQEEIVEALHFKSPKKFIGSLKRENLVYKVLHSQNELDDITYELRRNPGSSIIFTRTRKQTFEIAGFLKEKGFDSSYFHAKLPIEEKEKKQKEWTKSNSQIMVATNAFGMGIDKANVRNVFHLDLTSSLEAYVQEAGRAGRDNKPAQSILFVQPYAAEEAEKIFKSSLPDREEFELIERMFYNYFEIGENERPMEVRTFDFNSFVKKYNLNRKRTEKVLSFLEQKEVITFLKSPGYSKVQLFSHPDQNSFPKTTQYNIIEVMVRRYPGILNEERAINEFEIAVQLNKSVKKIKKHLKSLEDTGYLIYNEKNIQSVSFERPRESDYIKNILWREFEKVQLAQWKRLQDMIYYATQDEICREKLILRYFGEKPGKRCGECDVCKNESIEIPDETLLEFLKDSPKTLNEILSHFVSLPKNSVLDKLQELADEEKLIRLGLDMFQSKSFTK